MIKQVNSDNIWILALSNKCATIASVFSQDTEDTDPFVVRCRRTIFLRFGNGCDLIPWLIDSYSR